LTKIHFNVLKDKLQQYIQWERTPSNKKRNKLPLDVLPNINRMQAAERAEKCRFMSLVTLTFDPDLQTCPGKGPNTSSV